MSERTVYKGFVSDSTRWDGFRFRSGDIVISAPAKCGTTWMQRLVGLLVFDGPDLPASMAEVSPWLDMNTRTIDDVVHSLESQSHRRFIKTHTPLDGLPIDDRATYICVGRDPRDAAVSMAHHMHNMDLDQLIRLRAEAVGLDDVDPDTERPDTSIGDLVARLRDWMDDPRTSPDRMESLLSILHHFDTFWEHRRLLNVALFHYADLSDDLPAQMHRLAGVLGIDAGRERAAELAEHASLDSMRGQAELLAPNATQSLWKSTEGFFRSGTGGEWQELFTEADQRHYRERVAELTSPEVAAWAHQGDAALIGQPRIPPGRSGQSFRLTPRTVVGDPLGTHRRPGGPRMAENARTAMEMVAAAKKNIENLDPQKVAAELEQGDPLLVDLRESEERQQHGTIPGAVHAPRGMLEFHADPTTPYHKDGFDPSRRVILHCASGGRSALAVETLRALGYDNVAHLDGGFTAWKEAGQPVEGGA